MPRREFTVTPEAGVGARVDVYLADRVLELTRSQIRRLIDRGSVTVDGRPPKPGHRLKAGENVAVEYKLPRFGLPAPEDIPLKIIYEDADVIVIDKPAGLVVHPGAGHEEGTLVNALVHHYPELERVGQPGRPGVVHRLDKDTSGVMLVARSERAYGSLTTQFRCHEIYKTYLGLVRGRVTTPEGHINRPLGRHARDGKRISVRSKRAKHAETSFEVVKVFGDTTLLEIHPLTGRTHQIRVHLAAAGHPIAGDPIYGPRKSDERYPRLFLHAQTISFEHPATGARLEFTSPLPPDLEAVLEKESRRQGADPE